MVKVDVFVFKADPFGRSQFARLSGKQLSLGDPARINVASREVQAGGEWRTRVPFTGPPCLHNALRAICDLKKPIMVSHSPLGPQSAWRWR